MLVHQKAMLAPPEASTLASEGGFSSTLTLLDTLGAYGPGDHQAQVYPLCRTRPRQDLTNSGFDDTIDADCRSSAPLVNGTIGAHL
jgi:hypothetical protein